MVGPGYEERFRGGEGQQWLALQPKYMRAGLPAPSPVPPGFRRTPLGYEELEPGGPGTVAAAGVLAPGELVPQDQGQPWLWPLIMLAGGLVGGLLADDGNGNGEQPGDLTMEVTGPGGGTDLVPYVGGGIGMNWEAFADFGGFGKGSPQAEGWIAANRTTHGTGVISAETFRAWKSVV